MKRSTSKLGLAIAAALAAGIAGAAAVKWSSMLNDMRNPLGSRAARGNVDNARPADGAVAEQAPRSTYIVMFDEEALAGYEGNVAGLAAAPTAAQGPGRGRMDVRSPQARAYLGYLDRAQQRHEANIQRKLGRALKVKHRMKHAVNAITVEMTAQEATRLQGMAGIRMIEGYREYALNTDLGPSIIGAPAVWAGDYPQAAGAARGEGVVVGIIDTGINFGSPSFAGVDPIDAYQHVNPLGAGTYLGTCIGGGVDAGQCNDKLIGAYDFVCSVVPDSAFPAETTCNTPAKYRESPGGTDTNSHGSHTASTAAGNRRNVTYRGASLQISGVAPRANVVAYDVCYTNIATGQGSCPNVSTLAAVNQAVADGVDVINYSISGGNSPWTDTVSLAFLNAVDAGIYVAASAGNSGPGPNTTGHLEPWVGSTAASNTGRAGFSYALNVTSPTPVPANLAPLLMTEGAGGVALTSTLPGTTPLVVSPNIDAVDDGCAAYPASTFTGAIALIRRGTCAFSDKVNNATTAGAIAVVIANNQAGIVAPSVPGTTIPAFSVTQVEGNALRDHVGAGPATAGISYPPLPIPNVVDALAAFSSRGPGTFNLLRPAITAPGVSILAAVSDTTGGAGDDALVDLMSGTSMASPHHAGAAALIRQIRPTWSAPEILSALQMTATTDVYKEDTVTLGSPWDRGAGRPNIGRAVNVGLVLHETKAKFQAANPASAGKPETLNLVGMVNRNCAGGCTFTRTFRSTKSTPHTWTAKLQGINGAIWPSRFTVNPGETKTLTIRLVTSGVTPDGSWAFASMRMSPENNTMANPSLTMPIAVAVPPPAISLAPQTSSVTAASSAGGVANFGVGNVGGFPLNFTVDNTGTAARTVINLPRGGSGSGFRSSQYTDASPNPVAQFASDDFTVPTTTQVTNLMTEGFTNGNVALTTASQLGWFIYPDSSGSPAGDPHRTPGAATWSYIAAPNSAGVGIANATITLNLAAAGQSLTLPPGRYWLVVYARTLLNNRWVWFATASGDGNFKTLAVDNTGAGTWGNNGSFAGLAMRVMGNVECGASWIGAATPTMGQVTSGTSTNVSLQLASGLTAGTYEGYACFTSNDLANPRVAGRISYTVTP